jgi:hypothetical protein
VAGAPLGKRRKGGLVGFPEIGDKAVVAGPSLEEPDELALVAAGARKADGRLQQPDHFAAERPSGGLKLPGRLVRLTGNFFGHGRIQ